MSQSIWAYQAQKFKTKYILFFSYYPLRIHYFEELLFLNFEGCEAVTAHYHKSIELSLPGFYVLQLGV